jgi:ADP-ribosyl-[dinitrogen reductase] hydrolase
MRLISPTNKALREPMWACRYEWISMRTSISHPLQIAAVSGGSEFGRVGLTFCPGKYDPHAMSGGWDRELARDLDTIRDWGAAAVVTLLEPQELALLRVERLGEEVFRRHMSWFHLPITDVSTPDERFERAWGPAGEGLRSILRNGFDVLVHCRGGLGRAGTIAARLLVELGMVPATAIAKVREVRPGAIETRAQENFVLDIGLAQERFPLGTEAAIRDRAVGSFVGLAIGDAVGTTLEFKPRDSYKPLRDMVGGGPFHLNPGEWTDDTSMALCLADSLIETKGDLEKSISVLIETGSAVNASESKREQSGIIRRHFRGIKRPRQFFEVPQRTIRSGRPYAPLRQVAGWRGKLGQRSRVLRYRLYHQ